MRDLIALPENAETLARTVSMETGRPISLSRGLMSVLPGRMNFFLRAIDELVAFESFAVPVDAPFSQRLAWEPRGVVAHISAVMKPMFLVSSAITSPLNICRRLSCHRNMASFVFINA